MRRRRPCEAGEGLSTQGKVEGRKHRVVIVGGGTAGCATAIALRAHGVSDVVVAEMQQAPQWRIGEAIPPAAGPLLRKLGVWDAFLAQEHLPSAGSCASWGRDTLAYNDFILGLEGKGWHIDRTAFDAMLARAAEGAGCRFQRGHRLRDAARRDGRGYDLTFDTDDGTTALAAEFLVDTTGIASGAVRRLGVARNQIDSIAVTSALFELARPEAIPSQTLLEAREEGWWYAAKLPQARMIVALAVEPSARSRFADEPTWSRALTQTRHVSSWVSRGGTGVPAPLHAALAPSAILSRVVGEDWLAVGDAASAYDPIAAQGIAKALGDGWEAGEAIAGFFARGQAPLLAYQERVFERFRDYVRLRGDLYAREQRWRDAPFWRNRRFA
jgi:2-polyprenyl-6-methoxyphenol hydroxylase-like FAD-dependent oxidoreductase